MAGSLSPEERDRRMRRTVEIILAHPFKRDRKRALKEEFGIGFRTAESYLARAMEEIKKQASENVDVLRSESFLFYKSKAADKKLKARDQILAQQRIDKLLGLEVPVPTQLSLGGGVQVSMDAIVKAMDEAEQAKLESPPDADKPALPGASLDDLLGKLDKPAA